MTAKNKAEAVGCVVLMLGSAVAMFLIASGLYSIVAIVSP